MKKIVPPSACASFIYGFPSILDTSSFAKTNIGSFCAVSDNDEIMCDLKSLNTLSFRVESMAVWADDTVFELVLDAKKTKVAQGQVYIMGNPHLGILFAVLNFNFYRTDRFNDEWINEIIAAFHSANGRSPDAGEKYQLKLSGTNSSEGTAKDYVRSVIYRFLSELNNQCRDHELIQSSMNAMDSSLQCGGKDDCLLCKRSVRCWDSSSLGMSKPMHCVELRKVHDRSDENSAAYFVENHPEKAYGLVVGDEGWRYVPRSLAEERCKESWGSRKFFRVVVGGGGALLVNIVPKNYIKDQEEWWKTYYCTPPNFFSRTPSMAGINHGVWPILANFVIGKALLVDSEQVVRGAKRRLNEFYKDKSKTSGSEGKQSIWSRLGLGFSNLNFVGIRRSLFDSRERLSDGYSRYSKVHLTELGDLSALIRKQLELDDRLPLLESQLKEVDSHLKILYSEEMAQQDRLASLLVIIIQVLLIPSAFYACHQLGELSAFFMILSISIASLFAFFALRVMRVGKK